MKKINVIFFLILKHKYIRSIQVNLLNPQLGSKDLDNQDDGEVNHIIIDQIKKKE